MTIEWQLLADLRERRKQSALEAMLAQRRDTERSRDEAQRAQAEWQRCVEANLGHWQATRSAMAGGAFNVAQLRHAAAWSGALDARAAAQQRVVQQAQAALQERQRLLDERRDALRAAAAGVEKALHMQRRERARLASAGEARIDAVVDALAATRWAAGRSG
jgi:hypothetical protein